MRSSYLRSLALPFFCCPLALEFTQSSSDAMLRCRFTCCLVSVCRAGIPNQCIRKERKEKTTPSGVNLMRSQVLYGAAQVVQQQQHQCLHHTKQKRKKPLSCLLNKSARDFQTVGCAVAGDPIIAQPRLYNPDQHSPATCMSA